MKITAVKTAATRGHGMHLWVKVETDAGVTGMGECVHGGVQAIAIIQHLAPKLVGRDPFAIDAIFEDMRRRHVFDGGIAGALITALTGIEIALWDLKGKALKRADLRTDGRQVPRQDPRLCRLPGRAGHGLRRDQAGGGSMCWSAASPRSRSTSTSTPTATRGSEVRGFAKDSFNYTAGQWEHERMVQAGRDGDDARPATMSPSPPMCTPASTCPAPSAWPRDLEQYHLMWLEEPVPAENIDAMREVKRAHHHADLRRRESLPAPRLPRPDREAGGRHHHARHPQVRRAVRVSQDRQHGRALLHSLCAAQRRHRRSARWPRRMSAPRVPNFLVLEFHWLHRDYWTTIIQEKEDIIKDGYITLSDRPGIGVELDEEVGRQYQYPGTTWFAG